MTRYTLEIIVRSAGREVQRGSIPFDNHHEPEELEAWDVAPAISHLLDFMSKRQEDA